jgi:predicted extracellular nuclease
MFSATKHTDAVASNSDLEALEGMSVTVPQTLFVTDNCDLGRYGEVELSATNRLFQPTQAVDPGAAAQAQSARFRPGRSRW